MTSNTRTPGIADGTAALAEAIRRGKRPDWLDVPLISRDREVWGLVRTLYALRRLP
ncbi:hypothetical protein ACFY04_25970 [Streptomyces sp. NPDC001549]|uniref:hypothetical protein n=1 Tax=Streptomyces sp. NPDC001549 TaxID=3364586 RepID=UPI0036ADF04A